MFLSHFKSYFRVLDFYFFRVYKENNYKINISLALNLWSEFMITMKPQYDSFRQNSWSLSNVTGDAPAYPLF